MSVVTGAGAGIGAACALALAESGLHVVCVDRNALALDHVLAEVQRQGGSAQAECVDLSDLAAAQVLIHGIGASFGRLDVLVNNAAIHPKQDGRKHRLDELDVAQWQAVLEVNLTAPFVLCQAAVPLMARHAWGRIVNIVSRAGRTYSPQAGAHYAASKAGLIGFTRILAGEVGPMGITANCIAPGRIDTPLAGEGGPAANAGYAAQTPVGRVGTPREIGAAVRFLAGEESGFTTGATLDVNGGAFMG
ncbi:SDR family NAD(P)-dependent oxidoreductase [Variovorax sp. J22P168]|uniref:SDR family oxidoreductase n=1 Tax=Variovorax jilinensis TaxID=3053513 RepID=UPI002577445C|nr:SDR family NAD(P)-dependent oxidoreductase [Variovorax sp. J22P168]MDM0015167.1 SDR family NAD(P)-dependent oxidoreductase [Variovorax sp. J22P168]